VSVELVAVHANDVVLTSAVPLASHITSLMAARCLPPFQGTGVLEGQLELGSEVPEG